MPRRDNPVAIEARGTVGVSGGVMASRDGELRISLPAGAVSSARTLVVRDLDHPRLVRRDGSGVRPWVAFDIVLMDEAGGTLPGRLDAEATITLDYGKLPLDDILPRSLTFFSLNEDSGKWEQVPCEIDQRARQVRVRTAHFSGWAAGEMPRAATSCPASRWPRRACSPARPRRPSG